MGTYGYHHYTPILHTWCICNMIFISMERGRYNTYIHYFFPEIWLYTLFHVISISNKKFVLRIEMNKQSTQWFIISLDVYMLKNRIENTPFLGHSTFVRSFVISLCWDEIGNENGYRDTWTLLHFRGKWKCQWLKSSRCRSQS